VHHRHHPQDFLDKLNTFDLELSRYRIFAESRIIIGLIKRKYLMKKIRLSFLLVQKTTWKTFSFSLFREENWK